MLSLGVLVTLAAFTRDLALTRDPPGRIGLDRRSLGEALSLLSASLAIVAVCIPARPAWLSVLMEALAGADCPFWVLAVV